MALKKIFELPEGFTIEYWKVNPTFTVDMQNKTINAQLMVYKDKEARDNDKRPVDIHSFGMMSSDTRDVLERVVRINLSKTDFDIAMKLEDPRDQIYEKFKTLDFFKDALDV